MQRLDGLLTPKLFYIKLALNWLFSLSEITLGLFTPCFSQPYFSQIIINCEPSRFTRPKVIFHSFRHGFSFSPLSCCNIKSRRSKIMQRAVNWYHFETWHESRTTQQEHFEFLMSAFFGDVFKYQTNYCFRLNSFVFL